MGKSILTNIAGCYQNSNPSQTFFGGELHLQQFQEIVPGEVTF